MGSDAALDGPLRGHASEGALRACRCPIGSDIESPQAVERRKELGGREILLRLLGSTLRAEKQALERANRLKRGAEYALERRREGREGWGREGWEGDVGWTRWRWDAKGCEAMQSDAKSSNTMQSNATQCNAIP